MSFVVQGMELLNFFFQPFHFILQITFGAADIPVKPCLYRAYLRLFIFSHLVITEVRVRRTFQSSSSRKIKLIMDKLCHFG